MTACMLAAKNGHVDALHVLEQFGADINIADTVALHVFGLLSQPHFLCLPAKTSSRLNK